MGGESRCILKRNYKVFSCKDKSINHKLINIVSDLPQEYILLTRKIISMFEKEYNKKLNEIIYVSLTEHIHGAIERYHQGIQVKNPLLMEIKRLFAEEYEIGRRALTGYIAYHIVNAELNNDMINIANITKVMQQVLNVIKYHFKVEFNEESSTYYRFITHLKFFAQRIFSHKVYEDEDTELFFILKEKYQESYHCTVKIKELIYQNYNYELSLEEQLYLMIHIERIRTKSII